MDYLQRLKDLDLPAGHYAVFGSGPLLVRGIIDDANDIDVICRGAAWEKARALGRTEYLEKYDVTIVSLDDGRLTFGTRWAIGDFDTDELIDSSEIINDLPFVRLEHVVAYKEIADRRKDRDHIAALRAHYAAKTD